MGMFLCTQGMCSMVQITIGSKYSSLNLPFSVSSHANAPSCSRITQCANFLSFGHRKSPIPSACTSYCSCVYLSPGVNSGGCVGSTGNPCSGSLCCLLTILNSSGSVVFTGFTLFATGLYFLAAKTGIVSFGSSRFHSFLSLLPVLRFLASLAFRGDMACKGESNWYISGAGAPTVHSIAPLVKNPALSPSSSSHV